LKRLGDDLVVLPEGKQTIVDFRERTKIDGVNILQCTIEKQIPISFSELAWIGPWTRMTSADAACSRWTDASPRREDPLSRIHKTCTTAP